VTGHRSLCAGIAMAVALITPSAAGAQTPAGLDSAWTEVATAWRRDMEGEGVVGGSLWFSHDGKVLRRDVYGQSDRESGRAIDADTIYHWASITKIFTGIAILQLRDRGLISLDDPVVRYVPDFAAVHDPFGPVEQVTLRHLLSHTSGLRDPTWPWRKGEAWEPQGPADWSQIAAMFPYTEIEWEPGSRYGYSNPGISILGRVIEVVTHDNYESYIDKNILRPLGMDHAYFDVDPPYLLSHRTHNYSRTAQGALTDNGQTLDTGATVANGGLNAPVGDMIRFADFLLDSGDTRANAIVLRRSSLAEMMAPVHLTQDSDAGLREHIGLTFFLEDDIQNDPDSPIRYVGHTGSQRGYRAILYVEPRGRTAAVAAWNTRPEVSPRTLVYATRRRLFDRVFPLFIPAE